MKFLEKIPYLPQIPPGRYIMRRVLKNFSISIVGSVMLLLLNLGRTSLLIKSLPVDDYGRILIVFGLFTFLQTFLSLRVNDLLYSLYPQFKAQEDDFAIGGLLVVCLTAALFTGLLLSGGIYFSAVWVADTFYNGDSSLIPLIRIYTLTPFLLAFSGYFTAFLRLKDRFTQIVAPEIVGTVLTFAIVVTHLFTAAVPSLEIIMWGFVAGIVIQVLYPLFVSLRLSTSYLRTFWQHHDRRAFLRRHGRAIADTLFQTNLIGYLKLASKSGGLFLLGVFSTPTQVALYGLAYQLLKPLTILQNNIQTALSPELVDMVGQEKYKRLYELLQKHTRWGFLLGGLATSAAALLARPVILIFATPEYLDALPVFYIVLFTFLLTFISIPFYPVALSMGKLKWRNAVVTLKIVFILLTLPFGLNAVRLAAAQMSGSLALRLFFDIPLLRKIKQQANQ